MSIQLLLQKKGSTVFEITPDATVGACTDSLNKHHIGSLIVRPKNGSVEGIVTERDIMRCLTEKQGQVWSIKVRDIMTPRTRLITASIEDSIQSLMARMTEKRIRHLPVFEGNNVVGIISIGDLVKYLLDETQLENEQMRDYIYGSQKM